MAQLAEGDSAGGPQTGSDYETAFASEADTDGAIRKVLRIRHEFLERKNPGCQPQHQPASASASASACLSISLPQPQPASASARLSLPQPQPASASGVMSPAETELSPAEVEDEDSDPPTPSEAGGQVSNEAEDEISRQPQELNKETRVF